MSDRDPTLPAAAGPSSVLSGEIEGIRRWYRLDVGRNRVGSLSSSDVLLQLRGVSKRHAVIEIDVDSGFTIEDLGSKNGTFVNGLRVKHSPIALGDAIGFGPITLKLERASPAEVELAITLQEATRQEATRQETTRQEATRQEATRQEAPANEAFDTIRDTSQAPRRIDSGAAWPGFLALEGFVARLSSRVPDRLATALAFVTRELGARGAAVLEIPAKGDPVVIASYGEIDERSLDDVGPSSDEDVRVRHVSAGGSSTSVALGAGVGSETLACALWGGPSGRAEIEPLLRTLLRIVGYFRSRSSSVALGGARGGKRGKRSPLVFPPGYVRGGSPAVEALYAQMQPVARSSLPILITGETGVGKEWIARILHASSGRRQGPFVAVNCAAVPADLLEAEFFGISKGVATGVDGRKGKFELAQGGTLFLDEIGDMSKDLQAKLLRALEEKVIHPVGSSPVRLDVRLVAATNTDLSRRVTSEAFRRDLYYRLAGLVLQVPPLRERREDIPAFVEHFLRSHAASAGKSIRGLTVGALQRLLDRPWPGNVRELEHEVHCLVYRCPDHQAVDSSILSELSVLTRHAKPAPTLDPAEPSARALPPAAAVDLTQVDRLDLAAMERQAIHEALRRCRGNRTRAARLLGISRESLRRRLARIDKGPSGD